jgi:hypothetical protein
VLPQRPNFAALIMVSPGDENGSPPRFSYLPPPPSLFATISMLLKNSAVL